MAHVGKPASMHKSSYLKRRSLVHGPLARFAVLRSKPGRGMGLFALTSLKKGEFVIEYTGVKIPTSLADELSTKYLFELDDEWTIDGSSRLNTARYINHSCRPNCEADIRAGKILIFALRNVKEGEELSMDYGDEYFDEFIRPNGCRCDACTHTPITRSQ